MMISPLARRTIRQRRYGRRRLSRGNGLAMLPEPASFHLSILAADDSSHLGTYMLLAGLVLVTVSLMMRLRKRHRQRALEPGPHEQVERVRQMRGMRGDLEELMVEIEQMTKRLGAQLDAKALHLERLLDEANQKISRIDNPAGQDDDRLESPADASSPPARQEIVPDDPLARDVYQLADQGFESDDIARKLNEHVGKVELILALRSA